MRITHGTLRLYWVGALEPDQRAQVEARLAHDRTLQRMLDRIKSEPWPPALAPRNPWDIPAAGLGRGLAARVAPGATLGEGWVRNGEVCRIVVQETVALPQLEVVLLRRSPTNTWQVVAPSAADQRVRTDQLDRAEEGLCIEFTVSGPPGRQRWAVVLVPSELMDAVDFDQPDWTTLQAEVHAGRIALTAVDIDVEA